MRRCLLLLASAGAVLAQEDREEARRQEIADLVRELDSPRAPRRAAAADQLGALGAAEATEALALTLGDRHAEVRLAAARALGFLGPEAAAAAESLARTLQDPEKDVRRAAVQALLRLGVAARPVLPAVRGVLRDPEPFVRATALTIISRFETDASAGAAALARLLEDPDPRIRTAAADSLAALGPAASGEVRRLLARLGDRDRSVRIASIRALSAVGVAAEVAAPALVARLADREAAVAEAARAALREFDAEATDRALRAAADGGDARVALAALEELARIHPGDVSVAELHRRARAAARELERQARVRWLLARAGDPATAVARLVEELEEGTPTERAVAAYRLQDLRELARSAVSALLAAAHADPDADVRIGALWALGDVGADPEDLAPFLGDGDEAVCAAAAEALAKRGAAGRSCLVTALGHEAPHVRAVAASALGSVGPAAEDAVEALRALEKDPDGRVRDEAARALYRITGE